MAKKPARSGNPQHLPECRRLYIMAGLFVLFIGFLTFAADLGFFTKRISPWGALILIFGIFIIRKASIIGRCPVCR